MILLTLVILRYNRYNAESNIDESLISPSIKTTDTEILYIRCFFFNPFFQVNELLFMF
jgi:hypothetical protein